MVPGLGFSCGAGLKYNQKVFGHSHDIHATLCTIGNVLPVHVAGRVFMWIKLMIAFLLQ